MLTSSKHFFLLFSLTILLSGCYSLGWRFDECLYTGIANEVVDSGERQSFWGSSPTNVHGYTATDKTTLPTTTPATYCRGLDLSINQKHYAVIPDHNDLSPTTAPGSSTMTAGIVFQANTLGKRSLLFKEGEYGLDISNKLITFTLYNSTGAILHALTSSSKISSAIPYLVFATYEENYSGTSDRLILNIYSWDGTSWQAVENSTATFTVSNLSNTGSDLLIGKAGNVYFDGIIDEAFVSDDLLTLNDIVNQSEAGTCTPCGTTIDHYEVSHLGSGVTCEPVEITITGHDASHTALAPGALTTLTLTTSTSRGTWTAVIAGTGILSDPVSGDGSATYEFPGGESFVTLRFSYTNPIADPDIVNFNATDGTNSETTGIADPALDDPDLTMASAGFIFYNATDNTKIIPNQIAGKPSDIGFNGKDIELHAVRASDDNIQCIPLFPAGTTVTIDLGAECVDPSTCQGEQVTINSTAIATSADNGGSGATSYTAIPLLFGGAGSVADLALNYPDVGNINLHARYDLASPALSYMVGSTNYTVRPFGFLINVPGNPAAALPTGPIFRQAGADFTVTTTAVAWQLGQDTDIDGIADGHNDIDPSNNVDLSGNAATPNFGMETTPETVTLTALLNQPSPGSDPGLTGTTLINSFAAGTGSTNAARYDEVGIIEIAAVISDGDYLGIGPVATTRITSKSGYLGRFTPDHFEVTVAPAPPTFTDACLAGAYTYLGEPFPYTLNPIITLTAFNGAASPTVTENYDCGGFWKFSTPMDLAYSYTDSSGNGLLLTPSTNTVNPLATDTTDCNGLVQLTITDTITYDRPSFATPISPFAASVDLTITQAQLTDSDTVCYDTGTGCQDFGQIAMTGTILRHGRIQVFNNYGPETEDITNSPFEAQYYDGSDWLLHTDDDCTTGLAFCDSDPDPLNVRITTILPSPLSAGQGSFTVTTSGITGEQFDVCPTAPAWLTEPDCTAPDSTCGEFTFGIYRGNDRIINWREIVR